MRRKLLNVTRSWAFVFDHCSQDQRNRTGALEVRASLHNTMLQVIRRVDAGVT
jgi:hypothetical protein